MILDRFSGLIFLGDSTVQTTYSAFNILLRQNLALGALAQWELSDSDRSRCRCENQFINPTCLAAAITSSATVLQHDADSAHASPYTCARMPHIYLPIIEAPIPPTILDELTTFINAQEISDYKPIPIITSFSLSHSLSWPLTTTSMDTLTSTLASPSITSSRSYPFLWLGPPAAGHLKPPSRILAEGNNALWHFTIEMGREARLRGWDALGLYNETIQASSWDGTSHGMRVGLVQAMMVINWLARIEST